MAKRKRGSKRGSGGLAAKTQNLRKVSNVIPDGMVRVGGVRISLATPLHGGMVPMGYMRSVVKAISAFPKGTILHSIMNSSLLVMNRDNIFDQFCKVGVKVGCTHLLLVDADMSFEPQQIKTLVDRDVDMVSGYYCRKGDRKVLAYPLEDGETREDGLIELSAAGLGFTLIKAQAALKIWAKASWGSYQRGDHFQEALFHMDAPTSNNRYRGEDVMFFHRARELAGVTLWGDPSVKLGHIDMHHVVEIEGEEDGKHSSAETEPRAREEGGRRNREPAGTAEADERSIPIAARSREL